MIDYLIKGGLVFEGAGTSPVRNNVAVKGDRIVYVGDGRPDAANVMEAKGLVVCPGFIDTHAHSEFTICADGRAEGKLAQGITTEINGNCGLSAAPLYGPAFEHREKDLQELGIMERWNSFAEYFDLLRSRGIAINFATLCGHGNLRASVIGYKNEAASEKTLSGMKSLLSEAAEQGAMGLSTGLIYPPGIYSDTDELVGLAGGMNIYTSHMRSEGDRLEEAVLELISIGRESGVKVHVSHIKTAGERNWRKIDNVLKLIEDARSSGIRLTCDRYPYTAASTDLDTVLPSWVYDGGAEAELARLKSPETRRKIRNEISSKGDAYWKGVCVSSASKPENRWMEGGSIFDISLELGKRPEDALIDVLIDEKVRTGAIFFSMSEDNLKRFLSLPYAMIGSDSSARSFSGPTRTGKPHPRGFGSFPRFIGKYVRDERLMELTEAIYKSSYLPAQTFGIKLRGAIREGYYADIVVFDYEKIIDRATFKEPYEKPEGIAHVFVNGSLAFSNGLFSDRRAGRVLP